MYKRQILPQTYVDARAFTMNLSSTIYYTDPDTGEEKELRTLHGEENRVLVDYDEIPEHLIAAVVSIEDERFWTHHGVDSVSYTHLPLRKKRAAYRSGTRPVFQ